MNISENKNGTINLTVSKSQLGAIGNLCEEYVNFPDGKRKVPVSPVIAAMLVDVNDWFGRLFLALEDSPEPGSLRHLYLSCTGQSLRHLDNHLRTVAFW